MINTTQFSTNINIKCPARLVLSTGSCTSCPGIVGDSRLTEPGCSRQVCLLMFYHFQQMSTLWLTVWVWTFICLCFCDALLYCPGPRIDCGAPPSSDLSHLRQLLPSPSCDKTSFHFHANGVCCHLSQLLPSRCPLSTFFCKWSIMAPIQMNSFLFHANGVCLHFFHFHKKSIVLTWHISLLEVFQIRDKRKKEQHEKERQANIQVGRGFKCKFKSVWKGKCKTYSRLESILWTSSLIELPPIN